MSSKQAPSEGGRYRIGVDVGGTHTDLVLNDTETGEVLIEKLPSTPSNPALAVLDGVGRFIARGIAPGDIGYFGHGTTVATNALLEMKGAKVGLLINDGYRGIAEVQTQARDDASPFDYFFSRPPPLAPPSMTREIVGRIDYAGEEITPLDSDGVRRAVLELKDAGVESFAVCYLFSFMNAGHERATARIIAGEMPDIPVSLSSSVLPRIREWPRMSTTLLNAYLETVLSRYIAHIAAGLDNAGVHTRQRFLMQSNGGVMKLASGAGARTVHTLLSGPAAGVQAAAHLLAVVQGWRNIITMDMGGTSCDIAFIEDGAALEHVDGAVAGRSVGVPAFDIATISAGGGSIARLNEAGLLNVGPDSAGADPGPACYGKGGDQPTVTDADLVRGALNPDYFLGGNLALDAAAAAASVSKRIAGPMGIDNAAAAAGIVRLVDARMADEIRVQAARKGLDLAEYTIVPFGGAGPVHAAAVASELGIRRVLVPDMPGAFSALGLLCTDVTHDYIRSELRDLAEMSPDHMEACFDELGQRATEDLDGEGLKESDARHVREVDLRYAGQGYELRVPLDGLDGPPVSATTLTALVERFHQRHAAVHGHAAPDAAVELVSYRLRVVVPVPKLEPEPHAVTEGAEAIAEREVVFGGGAAVTAPVYRRDAFAPADPMEGPAVIEQLDATTLVPPGWNVRRDDYGNLVLETEG